ncbi:YopX family protein [Brevibacillus ginsengisoli]|uniref:YopX family protein n=1 Tax=Brevibacillus ginsengisoli TaxID=363854 RepID=UPI003CEBD8A5
MFKLGKDGNLHMVEGMQAGREIKFRAWHKQEKRMIDQVIYLNFEMPNPIIAWYETMGDALDGTLTDAFLDDVELMQFTALRDKNDKEIYEGDILTEWYEGEMYKLSVYYDGGAFMVKQLSSPESDYLLNGCDLEMTEVIGNIYEKPELLQSI